MIEGTFARPGALLLYRQWQAAGTPKARVISVHGFGEHGGMTNYHALAGALTAAGFEFTQLDLRGHGRSSGKRGHIDSWADFRGDLHTLVQMTPDCLPVFICGLSLGGLIVLDYGLHFPETISGIVSVVPPLGPVGINSWKLSLGRILNRLWPTLTIESSISRHALTRDLDLLDEYLADPLFHTRGSSRLLMETLATAANLRRSGARFHVPFLLLQGGADTICPIDGTFFDATPEGFGKRRIYEGALHNLYLETNRQTVFSDIVQWLDSQVRLVRQW